MPSACASCACRTYGNRRSARGPRKVGSSCWVGVLRDTARYLRPEARRLTSPAQWSGLGGGRASGRLAAARFPLSGSWRRVNRPGRYLPTHRLRPGRTWQNQPGDSGGRGRLGAVVTAGGRYRGERTGSSRLGRVGPGVLGHLGRPRRGRRSAGAWRHWAPGRRARRMLGTAMPAEGGPAPVRMVRRTAKVGFFLYWNGYRYEMLSVKLYAAPPNAQPSEPDSTSHSRESFGPLSAPFTAVATVGRGTEATR
ncbi:hypothetical protein FraEuI1c_3220 [Pseudofrankia inefficax]|uniref:Uncharacterized protein n=1 Tax=Pseudofrankia inefficax (strain DSM 45817 / CECT 9037 / DDB 130130 / EuI1c) TaxID=298654 RepID=E3IU40_PSEI1|nr:hypothetical protein FraEuI1c_3220 [Pseudofrankia inefficax]